MKDITVFGKKVSPLAAGAGAVGVGSLVVIWFAWRQHKSAAAAPSASAIDPLTGLPVSVDSTADPLTGETYLAEAQQYGSVQAAEQALSGTTGGFGFPGSGIPANDGGTTAGTTTVPGTTYGSNAAWAQAVEAGLTDIGYSATDVSAALGRYLGSLPETTAQAAIVEAALAEFGDPPVGSFRVILAPSPKPPVTGGGGIEVPDVEGTDVEQATQILTSAGFKVHGPAGKKGETHVVTGQEPKAGAREAMGTMVHLTYKTQKQTVLTVNPKPPIVTPGRH